MIYTQRVFWPQIRSKEALDRLLAFLQKHRPLVQEISFFTEGDGCDWRYIPPDDVQQRSDHLCDAVRTTREAGFSPVINILNTLGHSDEGGPNAPVPPWRLMMGIDGSQARQSSCPTDPEFLDYVRFKYASFARCQADLYWIDDDLRTRNHKPVDWGCFCPACIEAFCAEVDRRFDLDSLRIALRQDRSIRTAWVERAGRVVCDLLRACGQGIAQSHPGANVGLMTCDITELAIAGVDVKAWYESMLSSSGGRGWIRPGGGFWSDELPRALLGKSHAVANTLDHVPKEIGATYEVENYPYLLGAKSAAMTGLEVLIAILASRLDGVMFNVLDLAGNSLEVYGRWLSDLEKWKPIWDMAAEHLEGTSVVGWKPVWSPAHFQQHGGEGDLSDMLSPNYHPACALQLAGVPLTGFSEGADGFILCGEAAEGMSKTELVALLEKPLIMDGMAAASFLSFGLGDAIGLAGLTPVREGAFEVFSGHEANGCAAGFKRGFTMKYFGLTSHALHALPGTESLSILVGYAGDELGSALTLHKPPNSAPVAVIGHAPWSQVLSPQRMDQMRRLAAIMCEGFPFLVSCDRAIALWIRKDSQDRLRLVLFNPGFDETTAVIGNARWNHLLLSTPGVRLEGSAGIVLPAWGVALCEVSNTEL